MAKKSRNKVRIIAGALRGRQIGFPDEQGLRPTGDRLRETLFSWLQMSLPDSCCLDMFAGSGVLGFEAVSRGAHAVVMLEQSRDVCTELQKSIKLLGISNVWLSCGDATSTDFITHSVRSEASSRGFDVVFIDPPFAQQLHQAAVDSLVAANVLAPDASIAIESDKHESPVDVPQSWQLAKEKSAGEVCLRLYRVGRNCG